MDLLDQMPLQSVDMVFADPPYNLCLPRELRRPDGSVVKGVQEDWDKFASLQSYKDFTLRWLEKVKRVLKDDGTMWVIGSYHNIYSVGACLQEMGFWFLNDVVWHKTNPMPNFQGRRFSNSHETLLWVTKGKGQKYTFNYWAMKTGNEDKQMSSVWFIPICGSSERLRDQNGQTVHSTQKPTALLHRVIASSTLKGDIILDPFFGTGTTGVVARSLGRHFIGFEREASYVHAARQRLLSVKVNEDLCMVPKPPNKQVSFLSLIEQGIIAIGAVLYDSTGLYEARVRMDGSLLLIKGVNIECLQEGPNMGSIMGSIIAKNMHDAEIIGSIHKMAAYVRGCKAANGWKFWYYEGHCIDFYRTKVLVAQGQPVLLGRMQEVLLT